MLDFHDPVQAVYLLGKREEHLVQAEAHDEAHAVPGPGSHAMVVQLFCFLFVGRSAAPAC